MKMILLKRVGNILVFGISFLISITVSFNSQIPENEVIPNFKYFTNIETRKKQFFDFMRPLIRQENARVLKQRIRFLKLYEKRKRGERISLWDQKWLRRFMDEYKIRPMEHSSDEIWELLKRRIDIVPIDLALAQSANESAWGTSRFAIRGNAMFGQWTYSSSDEGIVPYRRVPGAKHKVEKFYSVRQSVRSYIRNLNTHPAYLKFRELRQKSRKKGKRPDGYVLAEGLKKYSERREAYVEDIREMIKNNRHLMGIQSS